MTFLRAPRIFGLVALLALTIVTLTALTLAVPTQRARQTGPWRRVFFDDFKHGLRSSRWGRYSGQPGGDPGGLWAPSHDVVSRGVLNLETYRDPNFGDRWVSGGVSSAPILSQTYGKYEVRLRMDPGKGISIVALLWPSSAQWPPEIDFAENGGETNARDHMTATLHYGPDDSQIQRTLPGDFTHWHVVGVEWTPGTLVYTVDGRRWAVMRNRAVPAQRMEMDLQTQAGTCGDASAPCPDSNTPARVSGQISWVAAYAYQPHPSG
jgi:beta-glucanase (GH16 family)